MKLTSPMDQQRRQFYLEGTHVCIFIVWFALTVGSTIPWLWMMSIDAHWYSTMYSWYTFASIRFGYGIDHVWVIYLKTKAISN